MRYTRPALLAVAVAALALPLATAAAAAPAAGNASADASALLVVRDVPNTTNYLDVERSAVERGEHDTPSLDVGAAVELETVRLRGAYNEHAFAAAYGEAPNETARTARLRTAVSRLDRRIREIERRQQRAIDAYNAGEITTAAFLTEVAMADVAARQVAAQFRDLRQRAGFALTESLDQRIDSLETDLVSLRGPVRARVVAGLFGERPGTTYALTTSNALVLATTDGNQLYREAHLPDNRASGEPNQFVTDSDPSGITAANERAVDLYPWVYGDTGPSLQRPGSTSVYSISLDHSQGELQLYLDGATRSVFREVQVLRLERVPTTTTVNTTGSLELRVNRTYGTGPMEVRVVDPLTGEPVDATVLVNGVRVGETGTDGSLWTVAPHRSVRLEARTEAANVTARFFAN